MALPNLRTPDPSRTGINEDTIVEQDLTDAFVQTSKMLGRAEVAQDSKYLGLACAEYDKFIEVILLFKKRLRGEQHQINDRYRRADDARRREASQAQR